MALKALVDEVQPIMTVDWHGFMHDRDGYGSNDIVKARAFHDLCMRRPDLFNKPCSVREAATTEGGMGNLGQYSTAKYGSTRLGGSWSWYGRDAAHLRAMGVVMLKAMATVCGSA